MELTPFNFLHSETILSQFRILADTIASSLPPDSPAKLTIKQQVQNIARLKRSRDEHQAYSNHDRYVADQNMYQHQLTQDEKYKLVDAQKSASTES